MVTTAVALVMYAAAAFMGDGSTRYAIFESKEACDQAVAQARQAGMFATDCVKVEFGKPRNGSTS